MAQGLVDKAVGAMKELAAGVMGGVSEASEAPRGEAANPANVPASVTTGRGRIPLSIPKMKLETPGIPGYYTQWFMDRPGRIQRALQAGFEFVTPEEIQLNSFNVANSAVADGNTNMGGSRVSLYGGTDDKGAAVDQYLMKQKLEYYNEDEKVRADRNERVASALRGGYAIDGSPMGSPSGADFGNKTVGRHHGGQRVNMPQLFIPQHLRKNFKPKG